MSNSRPENAGDLHLFLFSHGVHHHPQAGASANEIHAVSLTAAYWQDTRGRASRVDLFNRSSMRPDIPRSCCKGLNVFQRLPRFDVSWLVHLYQSCPSYSAPTELLRGYDQLAAHGDTKENVAPTLAPHSLVSLHHIFLSETAQIALASQVMHHLHQLLQTRRGRTARPAAIQQVSSHGDAL